MKRKNNLITEEKSAFDVLDKHAWNYFELHANQRISLFKLYIILLSGYITASGYFIIRIENKSTVEECALMFLSIIFIGITIIFFLLDLRNRKLIHLSEKSLRKLERTYFTLNKDRVHKIFVREKYYSDNCCFPLRHTYCFWLLYLIAIAAAGYLYWYTSQRIDTSTYHHSKPYSQAVNKS